MPGMGKAESAYAELERMIVFQEIPPASLVSESRLTEMTGFGRTPIREALQRLARERMVQIHPNKGVLIPATSMESQLRLLEMRRALEVLAVTLACQRARDGDRDDMSAMVVRLKEETFTLESYLETVRTTHHLITAAADNEYLSEALAPAQALSRRFWIAHMRDQEHHIHVGARLHQRILKAILDADESTAAAASTALNDYLVEFAYDSLGRPRREPRAGVTSPQANP